MDHDDSDGSDYNSDSSGERIEPVQTSKSAKGEQDHHSTTTLIIHTNCTSLFPFLTFFSLHCWAIYISESRTPQQISTHGGTPEPAAKKHKSVRAHTPLFAVLYVGGGGCATNMTLSKYLRFCACFFFVPRQERNSHLSPLFFNPWTHLKQQQHHMHVQTQQLALCCRPVFLLLDCRTAATPEHERKGKK